jgi:UDP-N-acetyl-D-mannosaminuronate dehydrogenase
LNNTIGIIGCGWLGLPLAKSLLKNSFTVKGSTTSEEKLAILAQEGIEPYKVILSETEIEVNIEAFLKNVITLIINVPPKLRGTNTENYVAKMQLLHGYIQKTSIKNVVFVPNLASNY